VVAYVATPTNNNEPFRAHISFYCSKPDYEFYV